MTGQVQRPVGLVVAVHVLVQYMVVLAWPGAWPVWSRAHTADLVVVAASDRPHCQ